MPELFRHTPILLSGGQWRYKEKYKKIPFNPHTLELASPTDPMTWGSFADALRAYARGGGKGIGFVFSEDDPFTGTDLDGCVENTQVRLRLGRKQLLSQLDSYTEYSPSGTGLHIITRATHPSRKENRPHGNLLNRQILHGNRQPPDRHTRYYPEPPGSPRNPLPFIRRSKRHQSGRQCVLRCLYRLTRHDEEVFAKATHARNAERFLALWEGKTDGFRSKSEADFTLVLYLLYWTNDDVEQTKRLFRQSGLYDEEKTDSQRGKQTYLDVTVENALQKRKRRHNKVSLAGALLHRSVRFYMFREVLYAPIVLRSID